ncbi:hypothetical protein ACSLBF_06990 [Pseudoalteromonas sp. T1lg65]|uniref:hypothetical protein n=1 Tax=Pseudoalteromonas sp. T1lg65 TaxID=2077101 RepID=UPI003F7AA6FA
MKTYVVLAALGFTASSFSSQAATVECLISGTPTPQSWSAPFCSSRTSSSVASVVFRLNANKPIAHITWNYNHSGSGRWSCTGAQCRFASYSNTPSGNAEACATRVLYSDGTWENLNSCAYGSYYYGSGPVIK